MVDGSRKQYYVWSALTLSQRLTFQSGLTSANTIFSVLTSSLTLTFSNHYVLASTQTLKMTNQTIRCTCSPIKGLRIVFEERKLQGPFQHNPKQPLASIKAALLFPSNYRHIFTSPHASDQLQRLFWAPALTAGCFRTLLVWIRWAKWQGCL